MYSVHGLSVIFTPRPLDRKAAHEQSAEAPVSAGGLFSFVKSWYYSCVFCLCSLCLGIGLGWWTTV
jgi:hypothetical protein